MPNAGLPFSKLLSLEKGTKRRDFKKGQELR